MQQLKHGKTLSIIIPIVYYHGRHPWALPVIPYYFHSMHPELNKYIPHFHTEMVSITNIALDQIGRISSSIPGAAFVVQKSAHEKTLAVNEFARIVNSIASEDQKSFFKTIIIYIFKNGLAHHSAVPFLTQQLSTDIKTKTINLREYFIAEGFEKGKQEGIEKGIE